MAGPSRSPPLPQTMTNEMHSALPPSVRPFRQPATASRFEQLYSSTDPTPYTSQEALTVNTSGHNTSYASPDRSPESAIDLEKQRYIGDDKDQSGNTSERRLSIKQRTHHFTWAWYTLTMSTGGISTLLEVQPHDFKGLFEIGMAFYIFNLILFAGVTATMLFRFMAHPGDLKTSLKHEREGLFFPTFWLSIATIIAGTHKYVVIPAGGRGNVGQWLLTSIAVVYWIYFVCTFLVAVVQYSWLFGGHNYALGKMMPSWFLPIFPVMLTGTIASIIAVDQPDLSVRMPILVAGLAAQGLGFWVAVFFYAHLIGRLMQNGLPDREHRSALFIGVGPPSFTALAVIGMSRAIPNSVHINGFVEPSMFRGVAILVAVSLWLLAFWFFCIALIAVIASPPKFFHLGWWAMVFPNSGFTIATISIGNALDNEVIRYMGNAFTICLVIMWFFVIICQVRAIWKTDIMWPGKDEDVADH